MYCAAALTQPRTGGLRSDGMLQAQMPFDCVDAVERVVDFFREAGDVVNDLLLRHRAFDFRDVSFDFEHVRFHLRAAGFQFRDVGFDFRNIFGDCGEPFFNEARQRIDFLFDIIFHLKNVPSRITGAMLDAAGNCRICVRDGDRMAETPRGSIHDSPTALAR